MRSSGGTSAEKLEGSAAQLDPRVAAAVAYVAQYMGDCDDWVDIKVQIMNSLHSDLRRLFSRRDRKTYRQVMNDFDRAVWDEYSRVSGVQLVLRTLEQRKALRSGVSDE